MPPRPPPGDSYNSHLVPYLGQHAPPVPESGDMNAGAAAPSLDAFYIQQAPNSFAVPLDVPDVNAYGPAAAAAAGGAALPPNHLSLRGPHMSNWGAPSRQSPAAGTHEAPTHPDPAAADVLQHGHYAAPLGAAGAQPLGAPRGFAGMYRPGDPSAHRQMMEQESARGARSMPKRRRTSPMNIGAADTNDFARFRGAAPPQRAGLASRTMGGARRDLDGAHGDGLSELLPDATPHDSNTAPPGDLASWILAPEDAQQRAPTSFGIPDTSYYRPGAMAQSGGGLRLDMPALPSQPLDAGPKMGPMRSAISTTDEEPLYVNAKQYQRILKRRAARARMEEKRRQMFILALKQRDDGKGLSEMGSDWVANFLALDEEAKKPYLHESRHKHAMRRPRGPGGRFLTTEEIRKRDAELAERAKAEAQDKPAGNAPAQDEAPAQPPAEAKPAEPAAKPQAEPPADASAPAEAPAETLS